MPALDQQPTGSPPENSAVITRNARYGLWLFALYLAFYSGFVLLNAFAPSFMEREFLAGINLAVAYGMALIVVALVLALIYCWLCRGRRSDDDAAEGEA